MTDKVMAQSMGNIPANRILSFESGKQAMSGGGATSDGRLVRPPTLHISSHDLERYYLGVIVDESELAILEEHLLICPACVDRAEATDAYVDRIRAAIIRGGFDLS